jgi:predicted unusual protein kinase regulating ubiquinone biosynthesis (AarF/ABC1/UbiB family)
MSDQYKSKIPRSIFGRASKMILTSTNLIGKEISGRITAKISGEDSVSLSTRVSQAKTLVETLCQMKGAAMKSGQFLSMELAGFLPEEVIDTLRKLHDSSTYLPYSDIQKILSDSWGETKFKSVKNLTELPIAAASIGQVHRATIDGMDVAIKIQFPGVADTIDSDVALIKKLVESYLLVAGKKIDFDPAIEEMTNLLKEEVDYINEAVNLKAYKKAFEGDSRFRVPDVLSDWSTKNVLVLSFEKGEKLNSWFKEQVAPSERKAFGTNIMALLIKEFFEIGIVQTDSNYGNFLYDKESKQIVLLDFGATKRYSLQFRSDIRSLLNAGLSGDQDKLIEESISLGFIDEKESLETRKAYLDFMECILDMVEKELQPFDFSNADNLIKLRTLATGLIKAVKYSQPAREIMFLDRKMGGIYLLLKEINCQLDLAEFYSGVQALPLDPYTNK